MKIKVLKQKQKKILGAVYKLPYKYLPNGSHDFFHIFRIYFLNDFIKNPQTRNARAFLPLNISAVGSV